MQAAYHLIKNRTVRAILGPQKSEQARFVVELGEKYQVPVIWFPITGPSLLPPPSPSSIYSHQGLDCFQFQAIAEVIEALGWQSIIPIYEDIEYGSHLVPCLSNVLKDTGIRMANVTAVDSDSSCGEINDTLLQLKDMRTHVFLVHMSMDLGARFVFSAEEQNMMGEGYAWILTQELSSLTDPRVNTTRRLYYNQTTYRNITVSVALKRYMQGALGVRPMDLISKKTTIRWEKEKNFTNRFRTTLTIYGWWAYHTIEVLAKVVKKQGTDNGIKLRSKDIQEAADFKSQSGVNFNLSDGRLYQSELEVYNVIGDRERIIGCWSPKTRLVQNCSKGSSTSDGEYPLKHPLWPGDTLDKPPKLRIGVPKTNSFPEFVNAYNLSKLQIDSGGFAVNVFLKAVQVLPFLLNNYEFVRLDDTGMTFDDLLCDQLLKVKAGFHSFPL
ncbi:glutamate receptor 2.1-like [Neltuma alba]|uniref:glutamate receptor 2.1-like n=1 Tax=Neltuma alba TaxID=207710 RepID=UPI0010A540AC|nr:glutamate receptor 2.1-like [Prosopis alba]